MGAEIRRDVPPPPPARSRRRRRWPFVVVGALVVIGAIGAWVWFVRIPGYRPQLQSGERYGIDVSGHQGTIAWSRVASDNVSFAYLKATEGGDFVDDRFAANWQGAADAGLDRGAYHFFTLCRPGADQADHFLRTVPRDSKALPTAVDLEFVGNCSARPSRDALLYDLGVFVDKVEAATGKTVVLYILDDFDAQYGVRQAFDRPRGDRSILRRPDNDSWLIWQASDKVLVTGIDGGVDLNVMKAH